MAMNKIGRPTHLQPNVLEQFQQSRPVQQQEKRKPGPASTSAGPDRPQRDHLEISAHARKLDELRRTLEASREALSLVPDVRQERIAEVRARLESGFYDSATVRESLAVRLGGVLKKLDSLP